MWCDDGQALESQPLPVPSSPSAISCSFVSPFQYVQPTMATVTRDGLDLAHCHCLSLIITGAVVDFCGVVMVVDAASFS